MQTPLLTHSVPELYRTMRWSVEVSALDYYSSFVVVAFFEQASETRQSKRLSAEREAFFSTFFFLFSPAKSAVCKWDG